MRMAGKYALLAGLALTATAATAANDIVIAASRPDSTALKQYAGARALTQDGKLVSLYGVPMTGGATPEQAAERFWAQHGGDFGAGQLDLRATRANVIQNGSTVIAYEQYVAGLPVDRGFARIVVHPAGNRVTLASGRFTSEPASGFAPMTVSASDAISAIRDMPAYADMMEWSEPTLVVHDSALALTGLDPNPRIAWTFTGRNNNLENPKSYQFFVDTSTGVMVEARDMISYVDITGNVQVKATPGVLPDTGSNPAVLTPVDLVRVTGPATVETDFLGNFLMPYAGSTAVNLSVSLNNGTWVRVVDQTGTTILNQTLNVTPPGPANFLLNNSPSQFTTAQANAFVHTIKTHQHFKDRVPSFTALDIQIPANVNINSSCNAYFDGSSINFFRAAGGCVNTAYADIVSHEYGHFVVNRLGLAQNAFGEGYGDSCGVLIHDTGIIGTNFCGSGCHIRNIDAANKQYPCSGAIHDCGQVLAGVWRDLRLKLSDDYGSAPALQIAGDLHVDWSLVTVGEQNSSNGAWPQTAIEVATVDDDDGTLLNGTPNYASLTYAFGKHNIDLPEVHPLVFLYPDGRPTTGVNNEPTDITLQITNGYEHVIPASAVVEYRTSPGDPFTTISLTNTSGDNYSVTIPAGGCGDVFEYRFSVDTTENPSGYFDPPTGAYSYVVVSSGPVAFADDFEGTSAFAVSGSIGLGLQGRWQQGDPNGTTDGNGAPVAPEDDATGGSGVKCWVTGIGNPGGTADQSDIDGGDTILTSPAFSLVGVENPALAYQRWFYNDDGSDANNYLIVEISNDNGTSWTEVEKVSGVSAGGWVYREVDPTTFVAPTATMKVRFRAADKSPADIVDAGIDDFRVFSIDCGCPADFDGSGFVDTEDYDAFVVAFEAGVDEADFDGSGFVDTEDFDAFVLAFEAGC
ncbi:MAG: hypothetical protein GIKADHBN_02023 [Phycisphaerales bacterium]|nr:hypothetical protein [Phycisphaerales bacterium]